MGVRLREYLQAKGKSSRLAKTGPTSIEGYAEFEAKLMRLGDWPKEMAKEIRRENHRIGRVGARVLKRALPAQGTEFVVYKRRRKGIQRDGKAQIEKTIKAGTLRRSIRTWNSRGSKINVQLGARRGGSINYDGYFAHFVDSGHVGGYQQSIGSKFYDKLTPGLRRLEPRLRRIQLNAYRRLYYKWANNMKGGRK